VVVQREEALLPFGRYVLKDRIARGGMGEVFLAIAQGERGFEKPVVVKRILPGAQDRASLAELFAAEANLLARLVHPNIVEVHDFGRGEHDDYFLVLELVAGVDLGRLLRAFKARHEVVPIPLALFITTQMLRGLHHAHTCRGTEGAAIVHRDISPGNVLLSREGEVKVADFGIARVKRHRGDEAHRSVAGKIGYMAPEQLDGEEDPRADLFSVGVVLYELVTGELPFPAAATLHEHQAAARRRDRRPLRELRNDASEPLEALVNQALDPEPDRRCADARVMGQALSEIGDGGNAIASVDDLAEAVRAAEREGVGEAKRVISLGLLAERADRVSDSARRTAEPYATTLRSFDTGGIGGTPRDVGPSSSGRGSRELVTVRVFRAEPVALGRDTVNELKQKEDVLDFPVGAAHGIRRARQLARGGAFGALLAIGAVVAWWQLRGKGATADGRGPPLPSAPRSASSVAAPPTSDPMPPEEKEPTALIAPPPSTATALAPHFFPLARVVVTTEASVSALPADCTGRVHISSTGSWNVSGGPASVQSPGWYTWRCGTFGLVARSRVDPTQTKTASVVVRADRSAEVDLR
jgi:serine/threonine-protein kinase